MDFLRLPSPIRRSLLSLNWPNLQPHRYITTNTSPKPENDLPLPTSPLSPASINAYTTAIAPNAAQIKYSQSFFHSSPPHLLFSAAHFRSLPPSSFPEVAFLGRSNVGKSSLLNALFGRSKVKDAHVSKRPGRTRTMNGFGVAGGLQLGAAPAKAGQKEAAWRRFPRGGLIVVDMPGYGSGSRKLWGDEAMKYLEQRKQLRKTYVLVDSEHGLKVSDLEILTHLRRNGINHAVVMSKVDKVIRNVSSLSETQRQVEKANRLQDMSKLLRRKLDTEAGDGRPSLIDILHCSAEKSLDETSNRQKFGIDEIRWSVLSASGMESDEFGQRRVQKLDDIHILDDESESL